MPEGKVRVSLPPRTDRTAYIVWMSIIWAAMLAGFGLDFRRYLGETPPPPYILHIHGAIYVFWLILVSVQIFLVQTGDIRLHMRLGWATAIVSAAMVPWVWLRRWSTRRGRSGILTIRRSFLRSNLRKCLPFRRSSSPACSHEEIWRSTRGG